MPDSRAVMIVAEASEGGLASIAAELAGIGGRLAAELGGPLVGLVLGANAQAAAAELAALGPQRVLLADDPRLSQYDPEVATVAVEAAVRQEGPAVVLIGQTPNGRDLAARIAFRLDAGLATDCTGLRVEGGRVVMTKPVYGGNALADYVVEGAPQVATVRPRAFEPVEPSGQTGQVVSFAVPAVESRLRLGETVKEAASEGPRLKDARIVVAGGRGLGGPENWPKVEELAGALGAAVGATRAVSDAGWVPPAQQVGLTGVTITPDLYITVAVSGAVQHIAGCSGARNIVAINKDPDANIFKHARYGVVGDWKQVLPAFTAKVKELRGR